MKSKKKEGELYRVIEVGEDRFEIFYGYYEERDRLGKYNDPIPIYPDLLSEPRYDKEGRPYVTEMQDVCQYYDGKSFVDICNGCSHYRKCNDLIGICLCSKNRKRE